MPGLRPCIPGPPPFFEEDLGEFEAHHQFSELDLGEGV